MRCHCGNPAKILSGDKPLCWTCLRRYRGMPEWLVYLQRPQDEADNTKEKNHEVPREKMVSDEYFFRAGR